MPWITLLLLVAVIGLAIAVFMTQPGAGGNNAGGANNSGSNSSANAPDAQVLAGRWERSDGYAIVVSAVHPDGRLDATYINPQRGPIKVSKAGYRRTGGRLSFELELRDEGYPGALYKLEYNAGQKTLGGTYYQPTADQTYEVVFEKAGS